MKQHTYIKRVYNFPMECIEKALAEMKFFRTKSTDLVVHYRRGDGLHVILTNRMKKDGRPLRKVVRHIGEGSHTEVKVHRDDTLHRVTIAGAHEKKFLLELGYKIRKDARRGKR